MLPILVWDGVAVVCSVIVNIIECFWHSIDSLDIKYVLNQPTCFGLCYSWRKPTETMFLAYVCTNVIPKSFYYTSSIMDFFPIIRSIICRYTFWNRIQSLIKHKIVKCKVPTKYCTIHCIFKRRSYSTRCAGYTFAECHFVIPQMCLRHMCMTETSLLYIHSAFKSRSLALFVMFNCVSVFLCC